MWQIYGRFRRWRRQPEVRFGLRFALGCVFVSLLHEGSVPWIGFTRTATASAASTSLAMLGMQASSVGSIVTIEGGALSYDVTSGCTAIFIGLLFVTAVFAFPSAWRPKLVAVVVGLPLLAFCNVVRLVTMGWVGVRARFLYDSLHFVYWQALLVLFVSVGFYGWTRWADPSRDVSSPRWRRASTFALASVVFLFVVSSLWLVGVWLGGILAYGRALFVVVAFLQNALWGSAATIRSDVTFMRFFMYDYVAVITLLGLFAASIRVPLRRRAVAFFAWALPVTFLAQAFAWALQLRSKDFLSQTQVDVITNARVMVLPILAWLLWALARARRARDGSVAPKVAQKTRP